MSIRKPGDACGAAHAGVYARRSARLRDALAHAPARCLCPRNWLQSSRTNPRGMASTGRWGARGNQGIALLARFDPELERPVAWSASGLYQAIKAFLPRGAAH